MNTLAEDNLGERIQKVASGSQTRIEIPYESGGWFKYFAGAFLIAWLVGWSVGWVTTFTKVISGGANIFLMAWLGAWTIGGAVAAYYAFRIFHPGAAEVLVLGPDGLDYDSGVAPLQISSAMAKSQRDVWRTLFPKRLRLKISVVQLRSLALRENDGSNRLTVDVETERLDIGRAATEIERERLAKLLLARYASF